MKNNHVVANFIIAGATRSGTTSLWYYLQQHPDIFIPDKKELWFFNIDENYRKGLSFYENYFEKWTGQNAIGDITPMYFTTGLLYKTNRRDPYFTLHDSAIKRIANSLPETKIILTLRNPVDRIFSQYRKNFYQGKKNILPSFEEHLERDLKEISIPSANFVMSNRYKLHLAHLLKYFPRKQIYIMIFEEWIEEPSRELPKLLNFLSIQKDVEINYSNILNTSIHYRRKYILKHFFKYLFNKMKTEDTISVDKKDICVANPCIIRKLSELFYDDISAVERTLDRSIYKWHEYVV